MEKQFVDGRKKATRRVLLRDIGVLQMKLVVDGIRDLFLVPAALIAGLLSLISHNNGEPGLQFYRLLAWGKESEVWINLFGALKNAPEDVEQFDSFGGKDIDDIVNRLESFVVEEAQRGGVTSQAKHRLEKILAAVRRKQKPA